MAQHGSAWRHRGAAGGLRSVPAPCAPHCTHSVRVQGVEDWKRHRADVEINARRVRVVDGQSGALVVRTWAQVRGAGYAFSEWQQHAQLQCWWGLRRGEQRR